MVNVSSSKRHAFSGSRGRLAMKVRFALVLSVALGFLPTLPPPVRSADEPAELLAARARYERDVEQAMRPHKDRYLQALEQIKRSLTFKGDLTGALAVQQEIESVSGGAGISKLAGEWVCRFANGAIHHYTIEADGTMYWTDPVPKKKLKTTSKGRDLIVEFPDDNITERMTPNGNDLQVDHFSPKSSFPQGPPATRGTAKRASSAK
jgi:hypothetical protein